ncbi:MAG: tetratricopeptide repeat protein [Planctomycetota bacterium]
MKKIIWILTCLIVIVNFVQAQDQADAHLQKIKKLIDEGKQEQGVTEYQKLLVKYPESIDIYRLYQNLMRELNRTEELKKECKAKLDKNQQKAIWHYFYGRLLEGEALEQEFKKAIELDEDFFWAYNGLGYYYKEQAKWSESIKFFEKTIGIKPDFVEARHGLALVYYEQNELTKAEQTWHKAFELAPDNLEIKLGLGLCYKAQLQYDLAIKAFDSVLQIDENYWKVYEPLIQCYYAKQDYEKGGSFRQKIKELYQQTKNKEFLREIEITIDVVKSGKKVIIVKEMINLGRADTVHLSFNGYIPEHVSDTPFQVVSAISRKIPEGFAVEYGYYENSPVAIDVSRRTTKNYSEFPSYRQILTEAKDILEKAK